MDVLPKLREELISSLSATIINALESVPFTNHIAASEFVQNVVLNTRARVASQLNENNADVASRLPVEIQARCFELLPLLDCISAVQVCASWRSVALSLPHLWSTIDLTEYYVSSDNAHLIMELCLARSDPVPFHLISRFNATGKISKSISDNLDRLGSLDGPFETDLVTPWISSPRPQLVELDCWSLDIPEHWGGHIVPRLRSLRVMYLTLPQSFEPVYTLRRLTCYAKPGGSPNELDIRRVVDLFPQLEALTVMNVTPASHLPTRLPACLKKLTLSGNYKEDASWALEMWKGKHSLREIDVGKVALEPLMEFFFAAIKTTTTFHMTWNDIGNITLKAQHNEPECIQVVQADLLLPGGYGKDVIRVQRVFDRLTHLEITIGDAQHQPYDYISAGTTYPALTDLVIYAANHSGIDPNPSVLSGWLRARAGSLTNNHIRAPKLRRLVIHSRDILSIVRQRGSEALELVRSLVAFDDQYLESVTIVSTDKWSFDVCDFSFLFTFADALIYQNPQEPSQNCRRARLGGENRE